MRINVYSQELTTETTLVSQRANTGHTYYGVRLFLHSSDMLHKPPGDDDRSAITLWLPKSTDRREALAQTLERMATAVRRAPRGVGLD